MKKISFVIPVYNEANILAKEITQMVEEINTSFLGLDYEIFLVENGSVDDTPGIIERLKQKYSAVRFVRLPIADYGLALKKAIAENQGEYVVVFNVDFWDVKFVREALESMRNGSDIVIGSKSMRGARDARPFFRRMITRCFNLTLKILFGFKGTDTHGLKVMVSSKILPLVAECRTDGVIFDTELILRAQRDGLKIKDTPVFCEEKRGTRLQIGKSVARTLKDLATLFYFLNYRLLVGGLLALAIVFFIASAFWGFPDSPSPWFDEGINLGIAKTFAEDGVYSLRLGPGEYVLERGLMISTNYPVLIPIAAAFRVFGVGLAPAKFVMIIYLCLFLLVAYLFASQRSGRVAGAAGILLAVTFLPFYGNGLSGGLGEVPGLVFLFTGILLLDREKSWQVFLAGLAFGLCASTKVFYLVTLFALGASEIYWAVVNKRIPWKRWLLLFLGILMPLIIWLRTLLPNGFSVSEISQTLNYYNNPYAVSDTVFSNFLRFFTEVTPIHFTLLAVPLFLYIFFKLKDKKIERSDIVIAVFIILNIVWFLKTPGWYRYFFPAHLMVLVLFPAAIANLSMRLTSKKNVVLFPVFIILVLLSVQTIHFIKNRDITLYHNPEPRLFADYLGRTLGEKADVYFVDQPEMWFLTANSNVRQYLHMNPLVAFGSDFFKIRKLPQYIVGIGLENNQYIRKNLEFFNKNYFLFREFEKYSVYSLK